MEVRIIPVPLLTLVCPPVCLKTGLQHVPTSLPPMPLVTRSTKALPLPILLSLLTRRVTYLRLERRPVQVRRLVVHPPRKGLTCLLIIPLTELWPSLPIPLEHYP